MAETEAESPGELNGTENGAASNGSLIYPFTAIVGHEDLKKALILVLINPKMGNIILEGDRGNCKSTAVLGMRELLPTISVVQGCRFHCDPNTPEKLCQECMVAPVLETDTTQLPLVFLPINTTLRELKGYIDESKVETLGYKAFQPGILAKANRGILVIENYDRVDKDVLKELVKAQSRGENVVESSGYKIQHSTEFTILAIHDYGAESPFWFEKNFLLRISVDAIDDIEQRIEILKRVEEFTRDPVAFRKRFTVGQERTHARILKSRENLSTVSIQVDAVRKISLLIAKYELDNESFKAITQAIMANTAYTNRMWATTDDIISAGKLVIEHVVLKRRKRKKGAKKEVVEKVKERALEEGLNYLIYEERTMKSFEVFVESIEEGIPGLCITATFPGKLRKNYNFGDSKVYWLSEAKHAEEESLDPKRLDFEIMRSVDRFMREKDRCIILIDGFEHLVMENGFDHVMKFTKKVNDMASMHNATIVVPINPESIDPQKMNVLKKEFDKIKNYM